MSDTCYCIEELEELALLVAGDPRLAHLESCPRCRAQLASYRAFMSPADLPAEARPDDAHIRIAAALEQAIFAKDPAAAEVSAPVQSGLANPLARLLHSLARPMWRPAWGLVAILLIFVGSQQVWQAAHRGGNPQILRGGTGDPAKLPAEAARVSADGCILFSWEAVPDADSYQVHVYGSDLSTLVVLDAGVQCSLAVRPNEIPAPVGDDHQLWWRVIALQGADEINSSALQSFDVFE